MSEGKKASQNGGMSRRKMIRNLSMAAVAIGNAGTLLAIPTDRPKKQDDPEPCSIYELLTLWLVFSTSGKFSFTQDDISNKTGLDSGLVSSALDVVKAFPDEFKAARKTFGRFADLYNNPPYAPGTCPHYLETLGPVLNLKPSECVEGRPKARKQ